MTTLLRRSNEFLQYSNNSHFFSTSQDSRFNRVNARQRQEKLQWRNVYDSINVFERDQLIDQWVYDANACTTEAYECSAQLLFTFVTVEACLCDVLKKWELLLYHTYWTKKI